MRDVIAINAYAFNFLLYSVVSSFAEEVDIIKERKWRDTVVLVTDE